MSTLLRSLVFMGALAAPLAAPAAPTLKDVLETSGLSLSGYVDAGYNYMSGDSGQLRVFDVQDNSFTLHQAAGVLAYQPKQGAGALVNLTFGQDADIIAAAGSEGAASPAYAGTDNFDVTQAFVQYAAGPLTLMAGKFVTLNGAEVIDSRGVPNASRGILFGYAIPFTHTGIRGVLSLGSVTLYAGLNNGWDQLRDANQEKTGEIGVAFGGGPLSVFVSGYAGDEPNAATLGNTLRTIVDAVVTVKVSEALTLIVNGDVGSQEDGVATGTDAEWLGVAGYANVQFNPTWRASLRGEYFDDKDGFRTGTVQKWKEATLTLGYACDKNLDLLFEVRGDKSDANVFTDGGVPTDSNESVNLKALYKF